MTRVRTRFRPVAAALALLAAAAMPALAQDTAELGPDNRDFDQLDLVVEVDLDLDAGTLRGRATHRIASLADDLKQVRMHLKSMKVDSVTSDDGAECTSSVKNGILTIGLDRPRKKGEEFTLTITYGGRPESGMWFFRPSEAHPDIPLQVWTQGQGKENRHWIPCYDLPDDRLTSTVTATVPAGLTVLSNGEEISKAAAGEGRETHTWRLDRPHPPYLITLVAGTFDIVKRDAAGVPQYDYVPPGWSEWAEEVFGRTPDMMDFFQEYTGEKYPWGRYSQVTVWDFMYGGMENTGATTLNMRSLHKDGVRPDYAADGLVAHELAHMWFGDLITCRTWNHIWLNEGFATYFTDLWVERHHGPEDFAAARNRSKNAYMGGKNLARIARTPRPESPTDCGDMSRNQYVKGSAALHMLRHLMGHDAFREGMRKYTAAAKDRSVHSEELRRVLEAVHGQDLSWFFDQWVYGSGFPEIEVSHSWDAETKSVVVTVEQIQPVTEHMPLFKTPVDIGITWSDGRVEIRRHQMQNRVETWRIAGPGRPKLVRFDPHDWLVARVDEKKPARQWKFQLAEDPSNMGRVLAARALAGMGFDNVPALAKAAQGDPRYEVRAEACKALGKIGGRDAGAALVYAAEDEDSRVRRAALEALGNIPAPWSAETLAKHLASDKSVYAASEAAAALGRTKSPDALAALTYGLQRDSHRNVIRQRVMDGLRSLGDPRGAELAAKYLPYAYGGGIQHRLRHAALDTLVALDPHGETTRDWLLKLLDDPYFRMRMWAARHAAGVGLEAAVPKLQAMAEHDIGRGVKGAAKQALRRLGVKPPDEKKPGARKGAAKRRQLEARQRELRRELDEIEKELEDLGDTSTQD